MTFPLLPSSWPALPHASDNTASARPSPPHTPAPSGINTPVSHAGAAADPSAEAGNGNGGERGSDQQQQQQQEQRGGEEVEEEVASMKLNLRCKSHA